MTNPTPPPAITVYCGSLIGKKTAYRTAAVSLGTAMAKSGRPLVYGGGSKGIMGVVSGAVLDNGGKVTGVVPYAMIAAGGEGAREDTATVVLNEKVETVVVDSMHERKVIMAKRAGAFIGLPGGFGTFEEVLEVTTWTQLAIHAKPVLVLNVLGFYEPLRQLIRKSVEDGFITEPNANLIVFVEGPADHAEHETFDWGKAALEAVDAWDPLGYSPLGFNWTQKSDGHQEPLEAV